MFYYEVNKDNGEVHAGSSDQGLEKLIDNNGMIRDRLIVKDIRFFQPLRHYKYNFQDKQIIKKSIKEINELEEKRRNQKALTNLQMNNEVNDLIVGSNSDSEKLKSLVRILKNRKIL